MVHDTASNGHWENSTAQGKLELVLKSVLMARRLSSGDIQRMAPAWHQHTSRYQELDKKWAQEEQRINAEDEYNQRLVEANQKAQTSRLKSAEHMFTTQVKMQQLSVADRLVAQAQVRRNAVVAQSSSLAQRISLQRADAQAPGDEKVAPGLEGDQVVVLDDSDDEPAEQRVSAAPEAAREEDGGAVYLLSDSDVSAASESEEEDDEEAEDSVFPNGAALDLDVPERCGLPLLRREKITRFAALEWGPELRFGSQLSNVLGGAERLTGVHEVQDGGREAA